MPMPDMIEIRHETTGQTATVPVSQFRNSYSLNGWVEADEREAAPRARRSATVATNPSPKENPS